MNSTLSGLLEVLGVQALFQRGWTGPPRARPGSMVSPCEGVVQDISLVSPQADVPGKPVLGSPRKLNLKELLGGVPGAGQLTGGDYIRIYLAPWHLHYVLFPLGGTCRLNRHLPGNCKPLFLFDGAEVENERQVVFLDTEAGFPAAVFMIGSFLVSNLDIRCREGQNYSQGDLLGMFGLGSTVVIVTPPDRVRYTINAGDKLVPGDVVADLRRDVGHEG